MFWDTTASCFFCFLRSVLRDFVYIASVPFQHVSTLLEFDECHQ